MFVNWFKKYMLSPVTTSLELHAFMIFTVLALWSHWLPGLRWYGLAAAVAFTAWKEFWFDLHEEGASIQSGCVDFGGYCIGFALTVLVWVF
jgi:hypothetical protein